MHNDIKEVLKAVRAIKAGVEPNGLPPLLTQVNDELDALIVKLERMTNTLYLDTSFMEQLMAAAKESEWIPQEYYYMNDWINDCCRYLKTGKGNYDE